jgi:hypothetical protein
MKMGGGVITEQGKGEVFLVLNALSTTHGGVTSALVGSGQLHVPAVLSMEKGSAVPIG